MKKKNCYCSGITRKDGSKILCVNCEYNRIVDLFKTLSKPLSIKQIKKDFIEEQCIDDYTTGKEINGFSCKFDYILLDSEKEAIQHFQETHNI